MKIHENPWKSMKIHENPWKYMEINENQWKSMEINENPWKPMEINENLWKSLTLSSSRRRRRPLGAAWAAPDDQTRALTCPQCPRTMLDPSTRPGECLRDPNSRIQRFDTDATKYQEISLIIKKHNYIGLSLFNINKVVDIKFPASGAATLTWGKHVGCT